VDNIHLIKGIPNTDGHTFENLKKSPVLGHDINQNLGVWNWFKLLMTREEALDSLANIDVLASNGKYLLHFHCYL